MLATLFAGIWADEPWVRLVKALQDMLYHIHKSLQKLQKMCYHVFMKKFIKLSLLFVTLSSVSYSYELPENLAEGVAKLLENTMEKEQDFRIEKLLGEEIKNENQYRGVIELKKSLLKTVLDSIPEKMFDVLGLNTEKFSVLSDVQKESLALFSTQFEGTKIEMSKIKSPYLLAASLNVLGADSDPFSKELLKIFITYIPQEFLEGSEY